MKKKRGEGGRRRWKEDRGKEGGRRMKKGEEGKERSEEKEGGRQKEGRPTFEMGAAPVIAKRVLSKPIAAFAPVFTCSGSLATFSLNSGGI
jgi:hypothetical protein